MGKQYISTGIVGASHKSDVLDVEITKNFTITVSSDGFLKIWDNNSKELAGEKFVDKLGLHHLTIFEDVLNEIPVFLIATVSFSGIVYILKIDSNSNIINSINVLDKTDLPIELTDFKKSFWAPKFLKDPLNVNHRLSITKATGKTAVFELILNSFEDSSEISPIFRFIDDTTVTETKFGTCIDIDTTTSLMAVGHQNGAVYLFDIHNLRPIYTFNSFGSKKESVSSLSTCRCVRFSPGGTILAVARDSGSHGTITLYDVKYGETIGQLHVATHSADIKMGGFAHDGWCLSLSFNEEGEYLASGGFDNKVRIWNVATKEREATITISKTDVSDEILANDNSPLDKTACCALKFINKGVMKDEGGLTNDGIVMVGLDRAIRWFREAGGI